VGVHSLTGWIRLLLDPSVSDHSRISPEPHSSHVLTGISRVSSWQSSQSTSRRLEPTRTASIQFEMSPLGIHPEKFQIGWRGLSPRKALQMVWFSVKAVYGCGVQTNTEGGNLRFLGVWGLLPSFHRVRSGTTSNGLFFSKSTIWVWSTKIY
jgi:hypothetical protein